MEEELIKPTGLCKTILDSFQSDMADALRQKTGFLRAKRIWAKPQDDMIIADCTRRISAYENDKKINKR